MTFDYYYSIVDTVINKYHIYNYRTDNYIHTVLCIDITFFLLILCLITLAIFKLFNVNVGTVNLMLIFLRMLPKNRVIPVNIVS